MSVPLSPRYFDRPEAGRALARHLSHLAALDPLVVAIPRGGVPVAAEVAQALGAALDVCVARTLRAPGALELAIGAATSNGALQLNDPVVRGLGITPEWMAAETRSRTEEAMRQERELRPGPGHAVAGRLVVLVDDGIITGATARAVVRSLRARWARRIVLAVPLAAEEAYRLLRREVDELHCPSVLREVGAVGAHYVHSEPVGIAEVIALLEGSARPAHT